MEVCSTWTFCLGLVSVKVLGVRRGKVRLCHFVNLLGPWTRPGFSGHLALGVGAPHPEAAAGEQSGRCWHSGSGPLSFVCCHVTVWAGARPGPLLSLRAVAREALRANSLLLLMDVHCVCLCTRCGFESCKMITLLCCVLVSLALPKCILVVRESSRSVP